MAVRDDALEARPPRRSFAARVVGAFLLDGSSFEEVEHDTAALVGAALVVTLAGLARGIGTPSPSPWVEILGSAVTGLGLWLVAGLLIWGIGVRRMGYTSSYPELLRTIGFAAAPLLLLLLRALPLGPALQPLWYAAHAWALAALIVAVREALDVRLYVAGIVCLLAILTGAAIVAGLSAVLLVARPVS